LTASRSIQRHLRIAGCSASRTGEFETIPKIRSLINARQSMQVLRNRLFQLKEDVTRYQDFMTSVVYILSDGNDPIEFRFDADL